MGSAMCGRGRPCDFGREWAAPDASGAAIPVGGPIRGCGRRTVA
ncbi:hypothetical protein C7S17_6935 [Burkholderia thailandensis]|nr:hypothetical protein [Burkholderia thailandensis]